MRKLFSSTFLVTAMLAAIVGVGVAMNGSATNTGFTAQAGSVNVALDWTTNPGYGSIANQVYPSGAWTDVFWGQIKNNTATPGIAVQITGGSVTNIYVGNLCNYSAISGNLHVLPPNLPIAAGAIGGQWVAQLNMSSAANDNCQGQTISYDVTVNVTT